MLALALCDLRRLAVARRLPTSADWEGRMYGRVIALPEQADPSERPRPLSNDGQYGVFFGVYQIASIDLTIKKCVGDVSEQVSAMSPG